MLKKTPTFYLSLGLVALICLLGLSILASLTFGAKNLPVQSLWQYFKDPLTLTHDDLVINMRKARTLAAIISGAALALAGALIQAVLRNPLGDSGLLGINAGAAAMIVTTSTLPALSTLSPFWPALLGAVLAMAFFYVLGAGRQHTHPARLILVGAALNACLLAYTQTILIQHAAALDQYRYWVLGALTQLPLLSLYSFLPYFIFALLLTFAVSHALNIMTLQERMATSLGVNIGRIRLLSLGAAIIFAATATAIAGPIGFIGLVTPHIARRLCGHNFRWLLPYCLILGPITLLLADILARLIVAPNELPVGIVTACIGAPLLYVLAKRKKGF